jgi:CRISPR system Cascade subunit CasC
MRAARGLARVLGDGQVVPAALATVADELGIGMSLRDPRAVQALLGPALDRRGVDDAAAWTDAIAGLWRRVRDEDGGAEDDGDGDERNMPIVLGRRESEALATVVERAIGEGVSSSDLRGRTGRRAIRQIAASVTVLGQPASAGLDGCLFGRFASAEVIGNVDPAVHVSHAYTTHRIQSWADFFSAVADLATGPGASHINTQPLTSGVFYRFQVIHLEQLRRNLEGVADAGQRASLVGHLINAFARAQPAAKLGSTAPHSLPHELVAELTELQPAAGDFFEVPTAPVAAEARQRLLEGLDRLDALYGRPVQRWVLTQHVETGSPQPALDRLAASVEGALREREAA